MAAEICLSQLPLLVEDPNAGFQVCLFFKFYIHCCILHVIQFRSYRQWFYTELNIV